MPVVRQPPSLRPVDPAAALANMFGASSDGWVPSPDPAPSSDAPVEYASGPFQPRIVTEPDSRGLSAGSVRSALTGSPWTWASLGGVVVAVTFSIVFFVSRPPSPAVARIGAPKSVVGGDARAAAAAVPAAVPVEPIDLLPHIDLSRDTIGGTWRVDKGALISDASHRAAVGIRYPLPREYDFRVQFTQMDGDNCAVQMFTARNPVALVLGGWKRTVSGFQQIDGVSADKNPTGVRGLRWDNGRTHTSVVRVRAKRIECWLDGRLITAYATDGSDLSNKHWPVRDYPLGVGSEVSSTIFHKVELIPGGGGDTDAPR